MTTAVVLDAPTVAPVRPAITLSVNKQALHAAVSIAVKGWKRCDWTRGVLIEWALPGQNRPGWTATTSGFGVVVRMQLPGEYVSGTAGEPLRIDPPAFLKALGAKGKRGEMVNVTRTGETLRVGAVSVATSHEDRDPPAWRAAGTLVAVVERKAFLDAIATCETFASQDDTRPHLAGIALEFAPGETTAISTDGHRLTRVTVANATRGLGFGPTDSPKAFVLPHSALHALVTALATASDDAVVEIRANSAGAIGGVLTFAAGHETRNEAQVTCVDSLFPTWRQVVPAMESCTTSIALDSTAAMRVLDAAHKLAGKQSFALTLTFGESGVSVSGEHDGATFTDHIEGRSFVGVEGFKLGVNARYLRDWFSVAPGVTQVACGDDLAPIRLDCDDALGVVMPMRI